MLPDEVGQLVGLKRLDLSGNPKLQSVPAGLWSLAGLEELDVRGCRALELEHSLVVQLRQQTKCEVKITMKDPANPAMAELQAKVDRDGRLDLQNCGLATVPPDVGQLVGLKVLDLSDNPKLWSVPAGLAHLPTLTGLDISGCPGLATLQKLQDEGGLQAVLGYLKDRGNPTLDSLQAKVDRDGVLDLSSGLFVGLKVERRDRGKEWGVGFVTSVSPLKVSFGSDGSEGYSWDEVRAVGGGPLPSLPSHAGLLESLPDEVGQLVGLKRLDLSGNPELRSVPAGLWSLAGLEELDLSNCAGMEMLPDEVGQLVGLKKLDLRYNTRLRSVPAGLWQLPNLAELELEGCGLGLMQDPANPTLAELWAKVDMDGQLDLSGPFGGSGPLESLPEGGYQKMQEIPPPASSAGTSGPPSTPLLASSSAAAYVASPDPEAQAASPAPAPVPPPTRAQTQTAVPDNPQGLWVAAASPSGKPYFYNTVTKQTSWTKPC